MIFKISKRTECPFYILGFAGQRICWIKEQQNTDCKNCYGITYRCPMNKEQIIIAKEIVKGMTVAK